MTKIQKEIFEQVTTESHTIRFNHWDAQYALFDASGNNIKPMRFKTFCVVLDALKELDNYKETRKEHHVTWREVHGVEPKEETETTEEELFKVYAPCFNFEKNGSQIAEKFIEEGYAVRNGSRIVVTNKAKKELAQFMPCIQCGCTGFGRLCPACRAS